MFMILRVAFIVVILFCGFPVMLAAEGPVNRTEREMVMMIMTVINNKYSAAKTPDLMPKGSNSATRINGKINHICIYRFYIAK